MFNPTLRRRETILFFLIVVINGLTWIVLDIGLDTCARGRWRVEVSKMDITAIYNTHSKFSQFSFFTSIIFKNIIQFLFVCYFHYYCVCTNINYFLKCLRTYCVWIREGSKQKSISLTFVFRSTYYITEML